VYFPRAPERTHHGHSRQIAAGGDSQISKGATVKKLALSILLIAVLAGCAGPRTSSATRAAKPPAPFAFTWASETGAGLVIVGSDLKPIKSFVWPNEDAKLLRWMADAKYVLVNLTDSALDEIALERLDVRTGKKSRIATSPGEDIDALVSSDGRLIAFAKWANGTYQLWVVPAMGRAPQQLTHSAGFKNPKAFLSSRAVLYSVGDLDKPVTLESVDAISGTTTHVFTAPKGTSTVIVSKDGKLAAFEAVIEGRWDVHVVDLSSKNDRVIGTIERDGSGWAAAISPSSKYVAIGYREEGGDTVPTAILYPTQGGKPLSFGGGKEPFEMRGFSPDGKWIIGLGGKGIRLFEVETGREVKLPWTKGEIADVAFSPLAR
jgi:WD40 repeat protein